MRVISVSGDIIIGISVGSFAVALQVVLLLWCRRIINRTNKEVDVSNHKSPRVEIQ
jgi:hypothetical protein